MDYTSFSHGQLQSKKWLCENLEPFLPNKARVLILGSWYNLLGLMMVVRNLDAYNYILGIDTDPTAIETANKLCDAWKLDFGGPLENKVADANSIDSSKFDVVINCSVEHMSNEVWFKNIPNSAIVCLQSSDVTKTDPPWSVCNPNQTIDEMKEKYPMSDILFEGTKQFAYATFGYTRFMLIGKK